MIEAAAPRPPRHHRAAPRTGARGLSLLEMLLVVALIAVVGLITASGMRGGIDGMRLRNAGKEMADQLRYTRTQAIATGEQQRFVVDPKARTWTAANGRHGTLPATLEVQVSAAREVAPGPGQAAIAFYPDGGASGGRIALSARDAVWDIQVGWITGEVRSGMRRDRP